MMNWLQLISRSWTAGVVALAILGAPASAQFGLSSASRLPGHPMILGKPIVSAAWPAVGVLRYANAQKSISGYVCGGSAIAPAWFVTAAHCVVRHADEQSLLGEFVDDKGQAIAGILEVVLGQDNLTALAPGSVFAVDEIVVHEDFLQAYHAARKEGLDADRASERATITAGHDIAVVKLKRAWRGEPAAVWLKETEAKLGPSAEYSPIPDRSRGRKRNVRKHASADGPKEVTVMGYGYIDRIPEKRRLRRYRGADRTHGETNVDREVIYAGSARLLSADLPIVDTRICAMRYAKRYPQAAIGSDQICAGFKERSGPDSCQGDSGGPMVFQAYDVPDRSPRHRSFLLALVSWGHGCAEAGWYGIYTSVSAHADWLRAKVGGTEGKYPLTSPRLNKPPSLLAR